MSQLLSAVSDGNRPQARFRPVISQPSLSERRLTYESQQSILHHFIHPLARERVLRQHPLRYQPLMTLAIPLPRTGPTAGGDWGNTRYSSLRKINTLNVKELGRAWVSKTFDEGGVSRGTPVVKNRVMFVTAGRKVYVWNARTGEEIWSYKTLMRTHPIELEKPRLQGTIRMVYRTTGAPASVRAGCLLDCRLGLINRKAAGRRGRADLRRR